MTVFIRDLEIYAFHGVPDAEQAIGHRYRMDLELELAECPARYTDKVEETVDYGAVGATAIRIASNTKYRTVERLAQVIGEGILTEFGATEVITVEIAKPMPPAPMIAREAGVRLRLTRG